MENWTIAILFLFIYFTPTLLARFRRHRSVWAIFAVNLVLGATGLGWLWALIWALTGNVQAPLSLDRPAARTANRPG